MSILLPWLRPVLSLVLAAIVGFSASAAVGAEGSLEQNFAVPPDSAKPRVYWFWIYNRVDKAGITRDLEEFKAKGISGVNLICNGGYAGAAPLPGVTYQSPEWWDLFRYAVKEAKRLHIELGFNLSAGGWVMCGPWVTPDNAMKKVVQADLNVAGPQNFSGPLPQPETVDHYYHDYCVQALPRKGDGGAINPQDIIDLTDRLQPDGRLEWDVPAGQWTILRTGYTVTTEGQFKHPYPNGDIYAGGNGYQIDFLSSAAFDDHFKHLGAPLLQAVRQAGGRLDYFWSDSWECGKLTWTQDFPEQFRKYRSYDLKPFLAALPGAIRWADCTATFTATAAEQTLSFVGTDRAGGDHTVFLDNVQIVASGGVAVPVTNSSFETPRLGAGNYQYNPSGGAWTFSGASPNGSGIVANGSGFNNPEAPQGEQAAFVQAHGTISQVISGLIP
ncbi:MAG TPA: glycosyl hydrolase, partial [Dongiaceae bacterium]|nr:glycosyl hydrolase [Dongiaceae bacterium]